MKKILLLLLIIVLGINTKAQRQLGLGKMHRAMGITVANGKIYATNPELNYVGITNLSTGAVSSFGSFGSANGSFNSPFGITTDANGKLYVADQNNSRIQVFDANGNFITKFGTSGSAPGQLYAAATVFIGADTRIYVGEKNSDRVSVFDKDFNFLYTFGSVGSGDGQFNDIMQIYVDANQIIYVMDFSNANVQLFDGTDDGAFIRRFGSGVISGSGNGISVDEQTGTIYAADYSNIHRFDINGNHLSSFSSPNTRNIFIDPTTHHLFVANDAGLLKELDLQGNLINTYGQPTTTNEVDNITSPTGVVTDSQGNLFATTNKAGSSEIKKFNAQGEFISKISVFSKTGLAIDASDNLYAVGGGEIKKYNSAGTLLATKNIGISPQHIAVSSTGLIYVPENDFAGVNDRIRVYNPDFTINRYIGSPGTGDGQFTNPDDIALDESDNLYVTDGNTRTIQKFTSLDGFLWKITLSNPVSSIAITPNGVFYVSENDKIKKFDTNGNLLATFGSGGLNLGQYYRPNFMHYADGNLIVSENTSNRIMILPPTPEIGVSLAGTGNVISGSGVNIGNAPIGNSLTATFNIVSQGADALQLTGTPKVSLSGTNAGDFTIDQSLLPATLTGVTSFKVTYTGNSTGTKTATLTIATNDPDESSFSFNITATSKLEQTITGFASIADRSFGDAPFEVSANASSGLTVQFSSSNTAVATVSGNTITIVGAGSTNITAFQPGDATYNTAIEVVRPLVVNKVSLTASVVSTTRPFGQSNPTPEIAYTGFKNGETASNLDVKPTATINMSANLSANAGTQHTITLAGGTDNNYNFTYESGTLTIVKATASIVINAPGATYDGNTHGASVTTDPAGLPTTLTYNDQANLPKNAGNHTVKAVIDHANYEGTATETLVIAKVAGAIQLNDATVTYNGANRSLTPITVPSGLHINVVYEKNGQAVSQPKDVGTYAVTATIDDPNSETSIATGTLIINKASGTISITDLEYTYDGTVKQPTVSTTPSGLNYTVSIKQDGASAEAKNAGAYSVEAILNDPNTVSTSATATLTINKLEAEVQLSNLSFMYDGLAKQPTVTISPNISYSTAIHQNGLPVEAVDAGEYEVVVTMPGNENISSKTVTGTLVITKAMQTVSFNELPVKTFGDPDFDLTASSSQNQPIVFESSDATIAKITGSTVEMLKAGTVTIKAVQACNANYIAAEKSQTLVINKASQSITFNAIGNKLDSSAPFNIEASSTSGLTVTFEIVSGPATIENSLVTLKKETGIVVIKAMQNGDANYLPADSKEQSFEVTLDIVAGVGERFLGDIYLGPNPTTDVLNIKAYDQKVKSLAIYDLSGRVTEAVLFNEAVSEYTVSVSGYTKGIYIVDLKTDKGYQVTKRMVIK